MFTKATLDFFLTITETNHGFDTIGIISLSLLDMDLKPRHINIINVIPNCLTFHNKLFILTICNKHHEFFVAQKRRLRL